ncbi:serine hydrolase domain-containing protein [Thalassotalea atypica]|uniref:serine hydrolase domain-containing protein n=1 Tax=Thalassotalea atypica TaxID=2054316 RepID=UPI0025727899|nr:serine hydrolase domain-containing protein [Thalassotalea atypica]
MIKLALGFLILVAQITTTHATTTDDYDAVLARYIEKTGPGVAVIVTQNGKTLYKSARGLANIELQVPLNTDSIFRLGSITKQFTGAAIMMLAEQGKLSLDDNIHKYVPDFPTEGNEVTIKHLLTHTSGIANYTEDENIWKNELQTPTTIDKMLERFAKHPMALKTGEANRYSNTGYVLLGKIIEVASKKSYPEFIEQDIFAKLGMTNSHYGGHKIIPNRASGYSASKNGYVNANYVDMMWPHAAGSLLSTVDDMDTWYSALRNGKLISKDSYQQMISPTPLNDGSFAQYGFGLGLFKLNKYDAIGHGGGIHGFVTNAFYLPEKDLYVAVLNNFDSGNPGDIARMLAAVALELPVPKFTEVKLSKDALTPMMGEYKLPSGDIRKIFMEEGKVYSVRGEGDKWLILPMSDNSFFYERSLSYFTIDKNDKGEQVMNFYSGLSTEPQPAIKQ